MLEKAFLLKMASNLGLSPEIFALILVVMGLSALLMFVIRFCATLMPLTKVIDWLGEYLGIIANWAVLISCLLSAGNAIFRYMFSPIRAALNDPSLKTFHPLLSLFEPAMEKYSAHANGFLEGQWYLFGVMVLLGASYTLKVNEHVRVDLVYGAVSDRTRHWIDLLGGVFFLMPMCFVLIWFTWPWFVDSWNINEASTNAGGLIRWPIKLLLPVGFALLAIQGFSEIVKRAAALKGIHHHEYAYEKPLQ